MDVFTRNLRLQREYPDAFDEWHCTEDAALWDGVAGDGLAELDSKAPVASRGDEHGLRCK